MASKFTDTKLLDFMESQSNGDPWVARLSTTGRGFRVHNSKGGVEWSNYSELVGQGATAREAIASLYRQTLDNTTGRKK